MPDSDICEKIDILLVDDRQENLLSIEAVLACPEYNLIKAGSGDEALRYLLNNTPALILMDVQMPELNGFETAAIIKSGERTREIPIIFVTAINLEEKFVHQGYDRGAVDYIYKPYDPHVLRAKVSVFADIRRQHDRIARLLAVQQAATKALAENNQLLLNSELRFERLVESVNDYAIIMLDAQGRIVTWNNGARRINGYEECEVVGKHFSIFYPKNEAESGRPDRELREAAAGGKYEDEGVRIRKGGSQFWADVVISPILDAQGNLMGFSKVTRDLTERKMAEENLRKSYAGLEKLVAERTSELSKAKDEAEQAVRMRDEFLSIASHELKTPLTSLSLQLQIFNRTVKKGLAGVDRDLVSEKQETVSLPLRSIELVAKCEDQSKRLAVLLDELLDLTRIRLGKINLEKEEVELGAVVRKVAEQFRVEASQKGSEISVLVEQPVAGFWDLMRIEQIVTNLISNAVKYGEGKGISVTVARDERSAGAKIIVTDHGMGIPVEVQGQIFERFERAHAEGRKIPGLGLGLYICRQVVQAHGGTIRVESEARKGATFVVELPLGAAQEAQPKAQAS